MIKFKEDSTRAWERAKLHVPRIEFKKPIWTPKFPLKHKLPGANGRWSKKKWESSGFPMTSIPSHIPTMLNDQNWDNLVKDIDKAGKLSDYQGKELKKVKVWLMEGIPYRMKGAGTKPGKAKHSLNEMETQI